MKRKGNIPLFLCDITPAPIRQDWRYERVTTPRPPCNTIGAQLQEILPGEAARVAGVWVKRGTGSKSKYWYVNADTVKTRLTYQQAVDALAGEREGAA